MPRRYRFYPSQSAILALSLLLQACTLSNRFAHQKDALMPEQTVLSTRLKQLFAQTIRVCIGRYALEIPQEAIIRWGSAAFHGDVEIIYGGIEAANKRIASDISKIKEKDDTAEITYSEPGSTPDSWTLRFKTSKNSQLITTRTYINRKKLNLITSRISSIKDSSVLEQQSDLARKIRLLEADQIPDEPGFCIQDAFIPDNFYADEESVQVGIHFPSFPDINFSISSSKDSYRDYPNWAAYKPKLSLLYRIAGAQKAQGLFYPSRTVLREGKRDVQHWQGEESLIRRKDGTHDFEWAFVGTPRDVANPSEYGAHLYSKVAYDTVGAAKAASLTDDEAIALWDRLLSGLKFRVQVPGAPEGSYYTAPSTPMTPPPPVVWYRDQLCPKDGYYKVVVDDPSYPYHAYLRKNPPSPERAGSVFDKYLVADEEYRSKTRMVWVRDLDENGWRYSQVKSP